MTYRKDYKTKNKTLYPYREARINRTMMFFGTIIIILLSIIAFIVTYTPPLA